MSFSLFPLSAHFIGQEGKKQIYFYELFSCGVLQSSVLINQSFSKVIAFEFFRIFLSEESALKIFILFEKRTLRDIISF